MTGKSMGRMTWSEAKSLMDAEPVARQLKLGIPLNDEQRTVFRRVAVASGAAPDLPEHDDRRPADVGTGVVKIGGWSPSLSRPSTSTAYGDFECP